MVKSKIKIGIIAGCGLDNSFKDKLQPCIEIKKEEAKNDFGVPTSDIYTGKISGIDIALLTRHGPGYKVAPTDVNYRANIEAFRLAGCTHVLATTACGSLVQSLDKGQLVIPDSFIDRTVHRKGTFYDGTSKHYQGVCNLPMEPSFDPHTSQVLEDAATKLEISVTRGGTIVAIEGPRFSSKAESKMFHQWGGHLINMTTCPEVVLAKEAGLLYAVLAMVTDRDCWDDAEKVVNPVDVIIAFKKNVDKVKDILIQTVELIGQRDWDKHINDLKNLVQTSNITST